MARRKAEIQLQMQIETQEEWEELLAKEGLNVIDVYQEWCGPCSGMLSNLKKIKNEVGDQLLKFSIAKADSIDSLEKYRGHCEPCFLFYAGGCLVAVVRGANSPKILRTITEQLKQEHTVLDGKGERKEIKDPFISDMEAKEKTPEKEEEEEEEEEKNGVKVVTVALIKPDAVAAGKVDQILEDIKASGIEILRHEERSLTEDEVRQFYSHLQDEAFFEELVKFMASGPSHVLALTKGKTGENIISEFRDLIGPTDVDEAKTQAPESLRAKHGQQTFMNALHGSSSEEMATRELAFFFPDFAAPTVEGKAKIQRTLALVRPEAFKLHKDAILGKIRESGFKVAMQKEMHLTKEMAEEFYKEHQGQEYFDQLVTNMSSGPVLALGLARDDAIQGWRNMLGPKEVPKAKEEAPESLRAQFAVDDAMNSLHGSDSEDAAKRELQFFFPMEQTVAVIKPDAGATKDEIIDRIHEAGFRIAARKETTLSREIAEEFYADHKDKEYYNDLVEHMTSGPTYMMVLSREGAVDGWRSMIGPTDPTKAKEEAPDSLRAMYGESILKNAVHGSSHPDHAKKAIQQIFGDLRFNHEGEALETINEESEQDLITEEPSAEPTEKAESGGTKDVEEPAPEVRRQELEQEQKEEEKQEEQKSEQKSEEQSPTEEKKDEQSEEQSKTDDKKDEQSEEQSKTEEAPKEEEKKEEAPKEEEKKEDAPKEEEKKEEERKAPSPKPSESEAKPSETEAKSDESEAKPDESEAKPDENESKPTENEAKPDEAKEEEKSEDKPSEEEKKAESPSGEKTPDTQTEEKKEETKTSEGGGD